MSAKEVLSGNGESAPSPVCSQRILGNAPLIGDLFSRRGDRSGVEHHESSSCSIHGHLHRAEALQGESGDVASAAPSGGLTPPPPVSSGGSCPVDGSGSGRRTLAAAGPRRVQGEGAGEGETAPNQGAGRRLRSCPVQGDLLRSSAGMQAWRRCGTREEKQPEPAALPSRRCAPSFCRRAKTPAS